MPTIKKENSVRGCQWLELLAPPETREQTAAPSVCLAKGEISGELCYFVLVQPDLNNLYPRARSGEVGLLEGWGVAQAVEEVIEREAGTDKKSAIVAIVDVPSQAYGRREEALGIHQALAAAVSAYGRARLAGHPGKAMSGGFLAHGYQANRILALADDGVQVHAMGKAAAARVTLRSEDELDRLASEIPPMAYDLESYASLGMLDVLLEVSSAESPTVEDVEMVKGQLAENLADIRQSDTSLARRLNGPNRGASRKVRELMREQWGA